MLRCRRRIQESVQRLRRQHRRREGQRRRGDRCRHPRHMLSVLCYQPFTGSKEDPLQDQGHGPFGHPPSGHRTQGRASEGHSRTCRKGRYHRRTRSETCGRACSGTQSYYRTCRGETRSCPRRGKEGDPCSGTQSYYRTCRGETRGRGSRGEEGHRSGSSCGRSGRRGPRSR